jgi:hypothetical protein
VEAYGGREDRCPTCAYYERTPPVDDTGARKRGVRRAAAGRIGRRPWPNSYFIGAITRGRSCVWCAGHFMLPKAAISVLYRGCAIPVAWTVLPAGQKHAWRREWLRMLRRVRAAVPRRFFVLVLADRGVYARWLFWHLVRLGGASAVTHQCRRRLSARWVMREGACKRRGRRREAVLG